MHQKIQFGKYKSEEYKTGNANRENTNRKYESEDTKQKIQIGKRLGNYKSEKYNSANTNQEIQIIKYRPRNTNQKIQTGKYKSGKYKSENKIRKI